MKSKLLLPIILCLAMILACTPKVSPEFEKQVQKEAFEFETLLNKLETHIASIKNPTELDVKTIVPTNWLFEETTQGIALAIPISKETGRGMYQSKADPKDTVYYMARAGKLTPDTELYIAPSWNNQPFDWARIQVSNQDMKNYPQAAESLGYFKSLKVIKQPYMVPLEATHGVYRESKKNLSGGSIASIQAIVRQMREANPYIEKSNIEQLKAPVLTQVMAKLPPEISKVANDVSTILDFVRNLETKYVTPNSSSYDKQTELADYRNSMGKIKTQLSQIDEYLQLIKKWDFTNLGKYRKPQ